MFLKERTRLRVLERYGLWRLPKDNYVWFHGASVGEVNGIIPIIKRLRSDKPEVKILGTTTSVKGVELIAKYVDEARLIPMDNYIWLKIALGGSKITKFVFGETELWPATISYLAKRKVKIFMLNARISDFKINSYRKIKFLVKPIFDVITAIYCIDENNGKNFLTLGASKEKLKIWGNIKYDSGEVQHFDKKEYLNRFFSNNNPVVVLGSIRPGEEVIWFPIIKEYSNRYNFIIAPRHLERLEFFIKELEKRNIDYCKKSENLDKNIPVVLLDSFGELDKCYSIANISFVGASLIAGLGGHNPMEPARYGSNIIMGQYYENQSDSVKLLLENEAITIIGDKDCLTKILDNNNLETGQKAYKAWQSFQGLADKTYKEIFSVC